MSDDLTIEINGYSLSGWTDIRLTRGIERCPSDFEVGCTEKLPSVFQEISIMPGDTCKVYLGSDLVLTGFVDQYSASLQPDKHNVRIRGRSKCEDLVDCSAGFNKSGVWIGATLSATSALALATTLAAPFNITVTNQANVTGKVIPQFYVNLGETVYEVIERVSRYAGFLTYDGTDGNLILATPGQTRMATGFIQGVNVQAASVAFSMNQRYSDYWTVWQSVNSQADISGSGNIHGHAQDQGVIAKGRFRPLAIVSEQIALGVDLGQQRADWERNRRWGRSQAVKVTCDGWRDGAGTLWQPNAYATVSLPAIKINGKSTMGNGWVISEVSYGRSLSTGTTADVTLMPDLAFSVEPTVLQALDVDIQKALPPGGNSP